MVILEIWAHCLPKHYGVLLERKKGSGGGWRWGKDSCRLVNILYLKQKYKIGNIQFLLVIKLNYEVLQSLVKSEIKN